LSSDWSSDVCSSDLRRAPAGEVRATTGDAPRRISAVALRVAEVLVELTLHESFRSHVRLHRHSQGAEFGD
jgi:hypothetical protein